MDTKNAKVKNEIKPRKPYSNACADLKTEEELFHYENEVEEYSQEKENLFNAVLKTRQLRNNILEKYSNSLDDERSSRIKYAIWIFSFVSLYIVIALLLVILNHKIWLDINDNVLIALVGSTSVNVVGLVAIVLRFTFTNHHHKILDNIDK